MMLAAKFEQCSQKPLFFVLFPDIDLFFEKFCPNTVSQSKGFAVQGSKILNLINNLESLLNRLCSFILHCRLKVDDPHQSLALNFHRTVERPGPHFFH